MMKAVVIKEQNGEVSVEERERPSPGPRQVLIRVHACGICHSDLAVLQGAFPFAQFPLVPGHEVAGVVEEVGEGVTWPEMGARVGMPWLYSSCGHCEQCTRGEEVLCQVAPQVTGVTTDGGYAEFMLAHRLRRSHPRRPGLRRRRPAHVRRPDRLQRLEKRRLRAG